MAETTRPARARKAPAKAATKATKAASPPVAAGGPVTEDGLTKIVFALVAEGETKRYAVFSPPADSACVGKLYAPIGTQEVRVQLIGPASE